MLRVTPLAGLQPLKRGIALSILGLSASTAMAQDLRLAMPIDCVLGDTCYIQQFVDTDPGPEARDFTCGPLSYDGHKGTDFARPTRAEMQHGVAVLAAAPGRVRGLRDGMPDTGLTPETEVQITGRDCGNGVVLDHGDGWETQYCHMKQGSVAVVQDQRVEAGETLGLVGLSGRTEFPHLHLSVRRDGKVVDPFHPVSNDTCTLDSPLPGLWDSPLPYQPGGLLDLGFASAVPDYDAVKAGQASVAPTRDSPALVLFVYGFGARAGDQIDLIIDGPEGRFFQSTQTLDRTQAQYMRAVGRRTEQGLAPGLYTGAATLRRDDQVLGQATISSLVD